MSSRQQVAVVTGGGGGIGAAVAEELGRRGWFVVTVDPLVSVDGAERLPEPSETTAGRIVAAGGTARASAVSVTDREAVDRLFDELVGEHGGVDALVNVAGITRSTSFASGSDDDWRDLLEVHLGGWLNLLDAALPVMARAGYGRVVGVTSGSGWRPADAGAYSCAKRAVASLTWQLGPQAPAGVAVNAMSPIAFTRMVEAALGRARPSGGAPSASGGLSLRSMPAPADLAPLGAHLVDPAFGWCRGRVLFACGSEVAVVEEPRLLEVVRADASSLPAVLDAVVPTAWAAAEASQASGGGSNPRFGPIFDEAGEVRAPAARTCAVLGDHTEHVKSVVAALEARGVTCHAGAAGAVDPAVDAVVLAAAGRPPAAGEVGGWERVLAEHHGIVEDIGADAAAVRAVVAGTTGPVRLVTLTDAVTAGGRSRAQAAAQLARAGQGATGGRVASFAVSVESADAGPAGELAAHLVCHPDAHALAGAELAAGDGWLGLRSHPRPSGSITFGGPAVPPWLDDALRGIGAAR